eukprot:g20842.t1
MAATELRRRAFFAQRTQPLRPVERSQGEDDEVGLHGKVQRPGVRSHNGTRARSRDGQARDTLRRTVLREDERNHTRATSRGRNRTVIVALETGSRDSKRSAGANRRSTSTKRWVIKQPQVQTEPEQPKEQRPDSEAQVKPAEPAPSEEPRPLEAAKAPPQRFDLAVCDTDDEEETMDEICCCNLIYV